MKTNQYKHGVLEVIDRARKYNPNLGKYLNHVISGDLEFVVHLSNGTLKMPREVAHSQQSFPAHVPEGWIMEIERSFQENLVPGTSQPLPAWKKIILLLVL